jgi:uncharacterized small protein (DUF1192 family)
MAVDDDLEPQHRRKPAYLPARLEDLSIAELNAYIAHCESEIGRARAEIDSRDSHRGAAEALFRK